MDRTLVLDKHIIEAWGVWWIEWQATTSEKLREQALSPKVSVKNPLVRSESKNSLGSSTTGLVLTSK